jgi:arsenate reductase
MSQPTVRNAHSALYPELARYVQLAIAGFDAIPKDRREDLAKVAEYLREHLDQDLPANLIFICTHNSRRSHLSQIWAQLAAERYGWDRVATFSGGTEATAFNPRAVAALERCGFKIVPDHPSAANPRYSVYASDSSAPQVCFSKVYDAPPNPTKDFCAVMTCSEADAACPMVGGCDLRVPIRYEDPKVADGTEEETRRYDERTAQICREMFYLMSLVECTASKEKSP